MRGESTSEHQRHFAKPIADYKKLRLSNLTSPNFRHLLWLLYWPIYSLLFLYAERFYQVEQYHVMYCRLDDLIPFCEIFVIPYLFWFVYLIGMHIYTLLYDVDAFRKMMKFIVLTYSVTIVIYFIFPTCQELRPITFDRDNFLTRFMARFYRFDTSTNVCPSIHVIGSLAVMFTALHTKGSERRGWKAAFVVCAILICISTVFLKQHSVLDVLAAIPLCAFAYWLCFLKGRS